MLEFIGTVITFIFWIAVIVAVIAFWGYNSLRALSENIRESWSNIGVVGKKQVSLVNQLIEVVKGYQESEKLVMLKVSEDVSSANQIAQIHQQSSMVLSAVGGMAQKFPELKSNDQYQRLIDSIQTSEGQLESARQKYNSTVKSYNVKRSSIPHIFYASTLGFKNAPYLEFDSEMNIQEIGTMKSFSSDEDGERLNLLLGKAGNKLLEVGNKALEGSKVVAEIAHEKTKQIADIAHEKLMQAQEKNEQQNTSDNSSDENNSELVITCKTCGATVDANSKFCNECGAKLD